MSHAAETACQTVFAGALVPATVHPFGSLAIPDRCADPAVGPIALRPILTNGLPLSRTKESSIGSVATRSLFGVRRCTCDTLRYEKGPVKSANAFFDDYAGRI